MLGKARSPGFQRPETGATIRSDTRVLLQRLSSSKRSANAAVFVSNVPSPLSLRELQVSPLRLKVSGTLSAQWHGLLPAPSWLTLPLRLPVRAASQRLRKPGVRRFPGSSRSKSGLAASSPPIKARQGDGRRTKASGYWCSGGRALGTGTDLLWGQGPGVVGRATWGSP